MFGKFPNVVYLDCANFNMEDNTAASAFNHSSVIRDIHDRCTNVQLNDCKESQNQLDKFVSYFNINDDLSKVEKESLLSCLFEHNNMFVTDENPQLGLTNIVQHQIHLKLNFVSKHQRPYRLPADKREVKHIVLSFNH